MKPAGAILALIVRGYQLLLRPVLPPACRFEPSCSSYAIEALQTHGAVRGSALAGWRVLRCNPWGASGYDPVPAPAGERATSVRGDPLTCGHGDHSIFRHGDYLTCRDSDRLTGRDGDHLTGRGGDHLTRRGGDHLNTVKAS